MMPLKKVARHKDVLMMFVILIQLQALLQLPQLQVTIVETTNMNAVTTTIFAQMDLQI